MPEILVLLMAVTSATSKHPQHQVVGQMVDARTCDTIALMLNQYVKDEPDLVFVCKTVKVGKA